ncbi:plasmid mobilization protein [Advenella mandrilli]|uniref:plasmid mobilization protein n=1 Tax=Advenella mandrilli TaxID=2800330 RepID=UPI0038B31421
MHEPLSELIRIRVTPSQYQKLTEASILSGIKLSEYIRRLLISADSLQSELNQLREIVDSLQRSQKSENAILEILFLLRSTLSNDQITQAHSKMSEIGFKSV